MIKVYGKSNCMQCEFTKRFLDERNVEYEYIDVTVDEEAMSYIKTLGFQTVPVIEVKGRRAFFGFRPDKLGKVIETLEVSLDD